MIVFDQPPLWLTSSLPHTNPQTQLTIATRALRLGKKSLGSFCKPDASSTRVFAVGKFKKTKGNKEGMNERRGRTARVGQCKRCTAFVRTNGAGWAVQTNGWEVRPLRMLCAVLIAVAMLPAGDATTVCRRQMSSALCLVAQH